MLEPGDVVHVIERRKFNDDLRRHFIGTISDASTSAFRAAGYTFVFNGNMDRYERARERRVRVFPMGSDGLIINVAPRDTNVESIQYVDLNGHLTVTDYENFNLTVNEFGPHH